MGRYTGPACRLCRREGLKLYLKGEKCYAASCAIEKRNYPPGQHSRSRGKTSTYRLQLREKQKIKRIYGIMERQFRRYFSIANKFRGVTGTILLQLLERRLDNVVYRLGFASSRHQARQLVRHGNILVDGKKNNIPSYLLRQGQTVSVVEPLRENVFVRNALEMTQVRGRMPWIEFNLNSWTGKFSYIPTREEIPLDVKEQLVVELYKK